MEFFLIYLYVALEEFFNSEGIGLLIALLTMGAVALTIIGLVTAYDPDVRPKEGAEKVLNKTRNFMWAVVAVYVIVGALVPSKQGMAWIIGGATAYNVTQNEEAQKLPNNLFRAMNGFLEEFYKEEEKDDDEE